MEVSLLRQAVSFVKLDNMNNFVNKTNDTNSKFCTTDPRHIVKLRLLEVGSPLVLHLNFRKDRGVNIYGIMRRAKAEGCCVDGAGAPLTDTELANIKSHVRLCVLRILTKRLSVPADLPKRDSEMVNDLILKYMQWMGYKHSADMFVKESKNSTLDSKSQSSLKENSYIPSSNADIPALLHLVYAFTKAGTSMSE